ncbi:MAG: hypothetical protein IKI82_03880 [Lachnospiraceae bacterium]|nr:hypothetical protein [Lachnospiraceae bacterium]
MTWWVILLEALAFAAIFTAVVFLTYRGDKKYSAAGIHLQQYTATYGLP